MAAEPTIYGRYENIALPELGETLKAKMDTGAFTASSSLGCNFAGTVLPRPSGKNVFNVSLTFGPAPCALPGQAAAGIAVAIIAVSVNVLILRSDETSLRQRSTHIFAEALPGTPPIMPDRQLRRALDDARRTKGELAPADLLSLLGKYAEATGSVPGTFTYRNDELVIEFPSAADVPTGVIWTAFGLQGRIEDQQLSLGVQP